MRVIGKGNYTHRQLSRFLTVKQYLIGEEDGKRFLLLRFVNEGSEVITSFRMVIHRLMEDGKLLGSREYTYNGPPVLPAEEFGPTRKFPLDSLCCDVRVEIRSVRSHDYVYEVKRNAVRVRYAPEDDGGREALLRRTGGKRRTVASATKKFTLALLAATLLLVAAVGAFSLFRHLGRGEEEENTASASERTEEIRTC